MTKFLPFPLPGYYNSFKVSNLKSFHFFKDVNLRNTMKLSISNSAVCEMEQCLILYVPIETVQIDSMNFEVLKNY